MDNIISTGQSQSTFTDDMNKTSGNVEKLLSDASDYEYTLSENKNGYDYPISFLTQSQKTAHCLKLQKALEIYLPLAKQGNGQALLRLGVAIYRMAVRDKNSYSADEKASLLEKAKQLFEKAASRDVTEAFYNLGFMTNANYNDSESERFCKSIDYYKKAAEMNHAPSLYRLGHELLNQGADCERDQGLNYLEQAFNLGSKEACNLLEMFYRRTGGMQDENKADFYYRNAPSGRKEKYLLESMMVHPPFWEYLNANIICEKL